ncbi:MAG: pyridoxal-phosphate dependent enzyme [Flavobacteriales bacterium]|nr:pyridoxal-phosphate dependent enzyme [Flavobacteriales bacterium]MCX7767912.1 pyridoxal-phosphate dependent enzyme [Flavobacteriales bacterium]MDW8409316.1 pyridoxal-phosphate dependent enzyme [Flavobacteriales bacterium]
MKFYLTDGRSRWQSFREAFQAVPGQILQLIKPLPHLEDVRGLKLCSQDLRKLLPLDHPEKCLTLGEGLTPVFPIRWEGLTLLVKAEFLSPTGSFKDRGAAVMISRALEEGATAVVEDSSGNAGCAVAAYAAAAGISCEIYVPATAPPAKLGMIEALGARVVRVPGPREKASRAALMAAGKAWFASHVWCPWFLEGTRLFAYEVWMQCSTQMPDEIIFPTGNGSLLLGAWKGFSELHQMGLLPNMPALSAAFSEACAPLLRRRGPFRPTIADGIAVRRPALRTLILKAVQETGGQLYPVSEEEIIRSWAKAVHQGLYIEYTSAVSLAAITRYPGKGIRLVPLTGTGLKNKF